MVAESRHEGRRKDREPMAVPGQAHAGERLPIDDPRLIGMLREGIRDTHDLTLLRSDRAMTDCRPVSIISIQTAQQVCKESGVDVDKRRFRANVYVELESGNAFDED